MPVLVPPARREGLPPPPLHRTRTVVRCGQFTSSVHTGGLSCYDLKIPSIIGHLTCGKCTVVEVSHLNDILKLTEMNHHIAIRVLHTTCVALNFMSSIILNSRTKECYADAVQHADAKLTLCATWSVGCFSNYPGYVMCNMISGCVLNKTLQ